jgi:two-component system OmpR family response regulator
MAEPAEAASTSPMSPVQPHILVVDDDPQMRELIRDYLLENNLRASTADGGMNMDRVLREHVIDLILLDLRLGAEDGMQLARRLRNDTDVPVIMVTGQHDEADRVMGLEIVVDDYVTKPFSNRELLARVRAVLRRCHAKQARVAPALGTKRRSYRFGGWELNALSRHLTNPQGHPVVLSYGEFNLLLAFCEAPQRVLTRNQLLGLSRLHSDQIHDRSIDVQIFRLRRKIGGGGMSQSFIRTERGTGYIFATHVDILK